MPKVYPPEFFENKQEQARISQALFQAIPDDVFYHNAIIAVADLLQRLVAGAYEDDVFSKSHKSQLTPDAADLRHACGDCGEELQIVRPGKYQCANPKCGASR